jgi:KDO2-lipid IV(A) lauroyltransferase
VTAGDALVHAAERVLPRVPWVLQGPISETVGTIAYLAAPRPRRAVRANLSRVTADGSASVRRVFVNQVRQYLEVFQIPRIDRERFAGTVRVEGWERFACAYESGKGVVLASAHLGPVALVGQLVTTRGYDLSLPIEPAESELMRAVNRARSAQGFHLVPINSAFGIHRVLRRGGVLAFLADRAVSGVGERVEFFGQPALLPSAHVALALHTGAALVPAFTWREGRALVAKIEEPLDIPRTGDREADVREGVRRFAALLQSYVARHPEQWTVFEPVWGD